MALSEAIAGPRIPLVSPRSASEKSGSNPRCTMVSCAIALREYLPGVRATILRRCRSGHESSPAFALSGLPLTSTRPTTFHASAHRSLGGLLLVACRFKSDQGTISRAGSSEARAGPLRAFRLAPDPLRLDGVN